MKNTLKGYFIGVLSTVLLLGCVAYAASTTKTIEAIYNNIKIYVDGIKVDSKDANGNTVEPFIYNGTTYLPVRAVGEAVGKPVTWDGATQSVYLGAVPGEKQFLTDICEPFQTKSYDGSYNSNNGRSFKMAGKSYSNGFAMQGPGFNSAIDCYAIYNLDGKYQTMSFVAGHIDNTRIDDDAELSIYIDDKLYKQHTIKVDALPQKYSVPLNGALKVKIELKTNSTSLYGIADIIVE
ncbi:MAG: NPCBM/NEW2 domain-containing protein [Clostridia bacterium]|nr:NPCBM/NEW2 domain-containing protein [Clostridia bacterium]